MQLKEAFHRQTGMGLVELMIALVIGMVVVASALGVYANTFGANSAYLSIARLNNDLRAVMTGITRDLRRAGYHGNATGGAANPFGTITVTGGNAIQFAYDLDSNGTLDSNENIGYRLNNNSVQTTVNGGTDWENITDPTRITITKFQIVDNSPGAVQMGVANVVNVRTRLFTILLEGSITTGGVTYTRVIQESVRVRNEQVS